MRLFSLIGTIIIGLVFLSSCGGNNESKENEYEATKKMVIDIFQTDDGRKALRELITNDEMKQELVIESDIVKEAIENALISKKGQEMWKELFKDSAFVKGFSESINEEQEKLMKRLMQDSEYQKQMIELLQNPEISEHIITLMKSQQFRAHLEDLIEQALDTPSFQEKISEHLSQTDENDSESGNDTESENGVEKE